MTLSPSDFLGTWAIKRVIEDSYSADTAHFIGAAVIERKDEDWVYAEQGSLKIARAQPMQAERQYIWRPNETGFDIFFVDKRFFHRFDLSPHSKAKHWCDPDQYEVDYELSNWPNWQSTWHVAGPRKEYVMTSLFSPMS